MERLPIYSSKRPHGFWETWLSCIAIALLIIMILNADNVTIFSASLICLVIIGAAKAIIKVIDYWFSK